MVKEFLGEGPEDKIGKDVGNFDARGALDIDITTDVEVYTPVINKRRRKVFPWDIDNNENFPYDN